MDIPRIDRLVTSSLRPGRMVDRGRDERRGIASLVTTGPLFSDPNVDDRETANYRVTLAKRHTGEGSFRVEAADDRYTHIVDAELLPGAGLYCESAIRREGGSLRAESCALEPGSDGEMITRDEGRFRATQGITIGNDHLEYPTNIVPLIATPLMLRHDLFLGRERIFPMWFLHLGFWDIHAKVETAEEVVVSAGLIRAYRVRLRPYLGNLPRALGRLARELDRLAWRLLPPFTLHFAVEPPHHMVRFEFPIGPLRWGDDGGVELHARFPFNERGCLEMTGVQ